ncbi:MAG: hypothetical protein KatS3mg112_1219 [Thermogutta sp.]|nr:MAG: hypothetical protein KatS3mg112_1219 [Thermogutta sp.]
MSNGGPDRQVPPEVDVTGRSLRRVFRRGTLVVPDEAQWIIQGRRRGPDKQVPPEVDVTGTSLRKRT